MIEVWRPFWVLWLMLGAVVLEIASVWLLVAGWGEGTAWRLLRGALELGLGWRAGLAGLGLGPGAKPQGPPAGHAARGFRVVRPCRCCSRARRNGCWPRVACPPWACVRAARAHHGFPGLHPAGPWSRAWPAATAAAPWWPTPPCGPCSGACRPPCCCASPAPCRRPVGAGCWPRRCCGPVSRWSGVGGCSTGLAGRAPDGRPG